MGPTVQNPMRAAVCECCCDELREATECPAERCSYRMCGACRSTENERQRGDGLLQCPACRVYVPFSTLGAPKGSAPVRGAPPTFNPYAMDTVVFVPRCWWLRARARRAWNGCRPIGNGVLNLAGASCLCSTTIMLGVAVGRLVFCFFHDEPVALGCFLSDTVCTLYVLATGILGLVYTGIALCLTSCAVACCNYHRID